MIDLNLEYLENRKAMTKEGTQSVALNAQEKLLIEIVAAAGNLKPATAARALLCRGLYLYLQDGAIHEPAAMEDDVFAVAAKRISEDATFRRAVLYVEKKRETIFEPSAFGVQQTTTTTRKSTTTKSRKSTSSKKARREEMRESAHDAAPERDKRVIRKQQREFQADIAKSDEEE